jgi:SSS family solute:Na+ symporter
VFAVMGMYHFISKYMTDQTMVQRYLLAKSIASTVRAMAVSMVCCVLAWTMFSLIGTLLWSFYELNPERIVGRVLEEGGGVLKGDKVFPMFVGSELPPFLTGLILAGLAAATMSTLSSDLNSIGAVGVSDFYDRFAKKPTEAKRLMLSKILVISSGLGAIGISIVLTYYEGGIMQMTMDVGAFLGSVIGGGLLAMFMLGVFSPRTSKRGLYTGIAIGFVFTVWCMFTAGGQIATASGAEAALAAGKSSPYLTVPDSWSGLMFTAKTWWLPVFSNILTFILAYGASLLLSPGHRAPVELVVTHLRELWVPETEMEAKVAIPQK